MAESSLETYHGKCHCGAFQFTVKLPPIKQVLECNCSICFKKGYLWAFPPSDDHFKVEKGDGTLKDYQFGNKTMTHKFCPTCGTSVMGKRHVEGPSIGVNARTLEGVALDQVEIAPYDGAKLEPVYEPPTTSDEVSGKYHGSCHCGKVTYSLQALPLKDLVLTDCNCSICSRNAYLWLYPHSTAVQISGKDHLTCYRFNTKRAGHSFCSTCGVSVLNQRDDPNEIPKIQPVNMRALNGVDIGVCKVEKIEGRDDSSDEAKEAAYKDFMKTKGGSD